MPYDKEKHEMPHDSDNEYMSDDNDDDQMPAKYDNDHETVTDKMKYDKNMKSYEQICMIPVPVIVLYLYCTLYQ